MILSGKRLLITGVLTRESIACAVAERAQLYGAEVVLTSFGRARRLCERAVRRLPRPAPILELDVTKDDNFAALRDELAQGWETIDGALHAIAYAPPDALGGNFLRTPAQSAELAFRVSAFSFKALAEALAPLMHRGGGLVALDFDASAAWPGYDWMGVSKAALEAITRYVARDLGPCSIRANLVAAGPVRTVAAKGVPSFESVAKAWQARTPLTWEPNDPEPIADAVCFLLSDLARAITGEVLHVDGGFHALAVPARGGD